jgi:capsid protein
MSSTPRHVVNEFAAIRADYEMSRASRFVRHRTGTAPLGGGEDWNYREETRYYRDIEQARDMDRNDGLVGTLADRRVDNIVQQGFTLDTKTGDKKLDQDLWHRWQAFANDPEMCDIAGEMTFHEMERHVCRSESIDGDIIGVGTEDGPLQLHEAHAVQTSTKIESTFLGVTRDQYGKRTQYHVRYDLNQFATKSESIPIDVRNSEGVRQLFHVYNPKRISATRGVTQLAPVFSLSGMLEDINFAKLVQQQAVSCFAILSEKAVGSNGNLPNVDRQSKFGEPSTEQTGSGVRNLEGVSPGMFYDGREGETLKGFSPNIPNSEYFQQVKLILQIVGVNFGLPLCLILMDGSETNFSGWRGAVDEARKGFVADQLNLVRRWHSPVYRWWLHREMAMEPILQRAAERQGIDIFGHAWQLPTWSYIEPVADAEGDTAQLRNALTSPRRMHAARGKDWETIAEEIIDDNVYAIEKAQAKADLHNQKFPKAPPLSWRDLIPLPMPEGQTLAMQDPNAIAAQEDAANAEDAAAEKPTGEFAGLSTQQWNRNRKAIKKVLEELASGESTESAARVFLSGIGLTDQSIDALIADAIDAPVDTPEVLEDIDQKPQAKARSKKKTQPKANKDFDESKIKRQDDGKFGTGGGSGGGNDGKSTGAKSADLALPEPKMKVSAKSARQMEEMIQEDLKQGKTLEESFAQYDDGNWDYLEFAGKKNAIAAVEKALDRHDAKSGSEPGTTDEIDGQHWEDWVSDNYTSPVEDKLINEFKEQMRAKFGKQS